MLFYFYKIISCEYLNTEPWASLSGNVDAMCIFFWKRNFDLCTCFSQESRNSIFCVPILLNFSYHNKKRKSIKNTLHIFTTDVGFYMNRFYFRWKHGILNTFRLIAQLPIALTGELSNKFAEKQWSKHNTAYARVCLLVLLE